MTQAAWRLLEHGPGPAAWNMAVDEALLEAQEETGEQAAPILRLYRWRPAAVSLGRFQAADDVALPAGAERVRRLSGGAAIYHREDEVTYAVVAPYRLFGDRKPRTAYGAIHRAVARALAELGVRAGGGGRAAAPRAGLCFDHATDYDLVAAGRKLVGSAQRRRGRWFLQHGSLPLSPDPLAAGATSLAELLGAAPPPAAVERALVAAFAAELALELSPSELTPRETERARALLEGRYAREAWTLSGVTGVC